MKKKLLLAAGWLCLLFAAIPAIGFAVFNTGVLVLFLAAVFCFVMPRLWPLLPKAPRVLITVFTCIVLVYSGGVSALMVRQAFFTQPPPEGNGTVIVLGSKIIGDQPSLMLRKRLHVALDYLVQNPQATCIVTGGQGADEQYPEATVMKNYLVRMGIPPARILEEAASTNTRENFAYARALLPLDSAFVVVATDGFHQLRASILAKTELDQRVYAISSATPWGLLPCYWIRDMCGVIVAYLSA